MYKKFKRDLNINQKINKNKCNENEIKKNENDFYDILSNNNVIYDDNFNIIDYLQNIIKENDFKDVEKVNVMETTFIIPIKIDQQDRIINICTSLVYLLKFINTTIIIIESDNEENKYLSLVCNYLKINKLFHKIEGFFDKTKLINIASNYVLTPIISIYDCDILLNINSYLEAQQCILSGDYDLINPFNQHLIDIPPQKKNNFKDYLDFKSEPVVSGLATGGCLFINKEVFIKIGKMNEMFKAYGPEEDEIIYRAISTGYKYNRINGNIYHLSHKRLLFSDNNQYIWRNHLIWNTIRSFTNTSQLVNYYREELCINIEQNKNIEINKQLFSILGIPKIFYFNLNNIITTKIYDCIECVLIINLKHRIDRLEHITCELDKINFPKKKIIIIDAIKEKNGAIGCTKSHIKCLEYLITSTFSNAIILEDDFSIYDPKLFIETFYKFSCDSVIFDIINLSANVIKSEPYNNYLHKILDCQTTAGYLINNHFFTTLLENIKTGLNLFITHANEKNINYLKYLYAIDIYWKKLQPQSNWFIFYPKIGFQYDSYSDIENHIVNYNC